MNHVASCFSSNLYRLFVQFFLFLKKKNIFLENFISTVIVRRRLQKKINAFSCTYLHARNCINALGASPLPDNARMALSSWAKLPRYFTGQDKHPGRWCAKLGRFT